MTYFTFLESLRPRGTFGNSVENVATAALEGLVQGRAHRRRLGRHGECRLAHGVDLHRGPRTGRAEHICVTSAQVCVGRSRRNRSAGQRHDADMVSDRPDFLGELARPKLHTRVRFPSPAPFHHSSLSLHRVHRLDHCLLHNRAASPALIRMP